GDRVSAGVEERDDVYAGTIGRGFCCEVGGALFGDHVGSRHRRPLWVGHSAGERGPGFLGETEDDGEERGADDAQMEMRHSETSRQELKILQHFAPLYVA